MVIHRERHWSLHYHHLVCVLSKDREYVSCLRHHNKNFFFFLRMCTETSTGVGSTSGGSSAALPFARTRSTVTWHALHAQMIAVEVRALSDVTQPIPIHIIHILHTYYIHMCTSYIYNMTQPLPPRPRHYHYYKIVCIYFCIYKKKKAATASPPALSLL
jgi:hypothetical protein